MPAEAELDCRNVWRCALVKDMSACRPAIFPALPLANHHRLPTPWPCMADDGILDTTGGGAKCRCP